MRKSSAWGGVGGKFKSKAPTVNDFLTDFWFVKANPASNTRDAFHPCIEAGMGFSPEAQSVTECSVPELSVCSRESSEVMRECVGMFSPNISKQLSMRNSTNVLTCEETQAVCQHNYIHKREGGKEWGHMGSTTREVAEIELGTCMCPKSTLGWF